MYDSEPFLAERMSVIINDEKYTFLKPYGDKMKSHVFVINQHMVTGETHTQDYSYDDLHHYFPYQASQIIGYINRMIPTYKPR